jgi:hypothetical protein
MVSRARGAVGSFAYSPLGEREWNAALGCTGGTRGARAWIEPFDDAARAAAVSFRAGETARPSACAPALPARRTAPVKAIGPHGPQRRVVQAEAAGLDRARIHDLAARIDHDLDGDAGFDLGRARLARIDDGALASNRAGTLT